MSEKLTLDPGPPRRAARRISFCKCLCFTITAVVVTFIAAVAWRVVGTIRTPHRQLYHKTTPNATTPVYPLITDNDTFDIAVTVWLRATASEEAKLRSTLPTEEANITAPAPAVIDTKHGKFQVTLNSTAEDARIDRPLFSDVVFRGLRLTNKSALATVDFELPTARFKEKYLYNADLRATFLLIPSSPSLIDHVKTYSSWMPESINRPLEKTMADLALESFSISVPLLKMHQTPSTCAASNATAEADNATTSSSDVARDNSTRLVSRPFVVTRTQLRIIRETNLLNATAYNISHQKLKTTSCGQSFGSLPRFAWCFRGIYSEVGNLETLLQLEIPLDDEEVETRWAYAPYLDTKTEAAGPQDLVQIPVTRENCSVNTNQTDAEDPEFMKVSWNIAFSARSPSKAFMADTIVWPQPFNHSSTECEKMTQQRTAELWNGAFGHRFYHDAHPRRRLSIDFVTWTSIGLSELLSLPYWWSRISTAGISSSGVILVVAGNIPSRWKRVATWITVALVLVLPLIMLRSIARAEFGWRRWHPTLERLPATHQERRSERADKETSWGVKLAVSLTLAAVFYFGKLDDKLAIAEYSPVYCPPEENQHGAIYNFASEVVPALIVVGNLSQSLLNHRLRTYGGGYRAAQVLYSIGFLGLMARYVPAFVGRLEYRDGLSWGALVSYFLRAPLLWQALTLPPVKLVENDED
ncbi:hypothetical protein C8F01DRAFT_1075730 [Mycena amicta]|nr:hypothetical protein C8F01DRAFT_1075730 [Mycena amicta]